ncbi:MAG: TonB family protein [Kofleriaceae bacterium]|jgi:TonB family protein|nr:TonB family protein [Kofleriaceae bacterium]MBP9862339.1 TonB family protein [Kofleriaceae bacterium]
MPSYLHLTIAATVAVHLIGAVVIDVLGVVSKTPPKPPPPRVSMVDIDVSRLPTPPPEPEPVPAPEVPPALPTAAPPPPTRAPTPRSRTARAATTTRPVASSTVETSEPTTPTAGGTETYTLPSIGAEGRGPKMAVGRRQTERFGRGGTGGGTGTGTGTGGDPGVAPPPVSIAAIKTPAKPKGDFDYFDARKAYPPEAKALGIAGTIKAKLQVDDTGAVRSVKLLNRLGHGLDELAEKRARALSFTPALDAEDRPVASIVIWRFTFELPE